jgi:hypothetical protein
LISESPSIIIDRARDSQASHDFLSSQYKDRVCQQKWRESKIWHFQWSIVRRYVLSAPSRGIIYFLTTLSALLFFGLLVLAVKFTRLPTFDHKQDEDLAGRFTRR